MKTNAKIYVMRAADGSIKLGHSKNPAVRARYVGRHVELIHQTDVIEQVERIERLAHRVLALHGAHIRGEWFEATLEDALQAIEIATRQAEQAELPLGGTLNPAVRSSGPQRLFQMRTDTPEGVRFLAMLDELRMDEFPQKDRTAMMKKLVFEAHAKRRAPDKPSAKRKTA